MLKSIEKAVDFLEVRLALWLIWFFLGIPMFMLAGTGIWFGVIALPGIFGARDWYVGVNVLAIGIGDIWGLIAAAVRLANPAPVLATRQTARKFAMAGLLAGIASGAYPAIQTMVQAVAG